MDWVYIWAYWRIADRPHIGDGQSRHAPGTATQLQKLAAAEWVVREPRRGFGLWEGSAWGTHAGFQHAGIRDPRNFFLADKALGKKLKTLAVEPVLRRLRRRLQLDFAGVFREDPEDVAALRELGYVPEQLVFRGFVLVGWGVPRGIVWIGLTNRSAAWKGTPEERAVELFLPAHELPLPSTMMEGATQESRLPLLFQSSWRRDVARAHLAALGFCEVPGPKMEWARDGRRYGTGPKVNEFLLIEPSTDEIARVRQRQLRDERYPLSLIDYQTIMRAAMHFPWLWKGSRPPLASWETPGYAVLPPHPRWRDLHKVALLLGVAHVLHAEVNAALVRSMWPEMQDAGELLSVFDRLAQSANTIAPLKTFLPIDESDVLAHPTLQSLLRSVTEWAITNGDVGVLQRAAVVWRKHDSGLANRAGQRVADLSA